MLRGFYVTDAADCAALRIHRDEFRRGSSLPAKLSSVASGFQPFSAIKKPAIRRVF